MLASLLSLALAAPPSIDVPLRTGAGNDADAAVVIGNEAYAYLPSVPHADRDADAMYQALLYTVGVPAERIRDLRNVNREQIVAAVEEAGDLVGPDGRLWVYFAGHGAASPSTGTPMLVGDDAKRDAAVFDARSLTLGQLEGAAGVPVSLVLDACFAGVGRSGEQLVPGTRFAVPTYAMDSDAGSWVWTAASADQVAGPYGPAEHGLFTYFVVGALRGWADGELDGAPDGTVTGAEASAYVRRMFAVLQVSGQDPSTEGTPPDVLVRADNLEAAPDAAGFPRPDGTVSAPSPVPAPAPIASAPASAGPSWTPPLQPVGSRWADANDQPVAWGDIRRHVGQSASGAELLRRLDRNGAAQAGAVTSALVGTLALPTGIVTYSANGCPNSTVGCQVIYLPVAGLGAVALVGGIVGEVLLVKQRKRHKQAVVEAAGR